MRLKVMYGDKDLFTALWLKALKGIKVYFCPIRGTVVHA